MTRQAVTRVSDQPPRRFKASASWPRIFGWLLALLVGVAGLFFLKDAAFSAWAAGGPPGDYKLGWERRSLASLSWALACFLAGALLLRAPARLSRPGLVAGILAVTAISLAAAPFVAREMLIDSCLDSGGRWSAALIECEP
jgi:hypothetical protein